MQKRIYLETVLLILPVIFLMAAFRPVSAQTDTYGYMGKWNSAGVPDYLSAKDDTVEQYLLDQIYASLPESKNLISTHPQFITTNSKSNIYLKDSCEVYVTFVAEGAGYKNALGFYSYKTGNPPATVSDILKTMTVIFPNSSASGSGGGLVSGNRVCIGRFPRNTTIGWFLLADGYRNNLVTDGNWRLFSNENLNPEGKEEQRKHNVLLKDPVKGRIILGFEDIRRDNGGCDNDFNDVLYYIKANPITAIDTTGIPVIDPPVNNKADLEITKSVDNLQPENGKEVTYTVSVKNNGTGSASNIEISDLLPGGLVFVSATADKGTYSAAAGVWKIAELLNGQTANLRIKTKVDLFSTPYDLGPAKGYNVFVLNDINQPSSDTEGKMAVGHNAYLANYSIGDKLPAGDTLNNSLVVGNNLTFLSGAVYNGNIVYGNLSNLPASQVSITGGKLIKSSVLNFASAENYLTTLSSTLAGYEKNGGAVIEYGHLQLSGTNPLLNVFNIDGKDLSSVNNCSVNVPNGSVVLVNISGGAVEWHGNLTVYGTALGNVLYNFHEASKLLISNIDIRGSVLAPKADLDFPSGLITGQVVAKNVYGSGQFNCSPFIGNIPMKPVIINEARVAALDQTDPVLTNNSSSALITAKFPAQPDNGELPDGSEWQSDVVFPAGDFVWTMENDNEGNLLIGTFGGKIYSSSGSNGWTRINEGMNASYIWSLSVKSDGTIYAATERGLYKSTENAASWNTTNLKDMDIRAVALDKNGILYAGIWGGGVLKSADGGSSWNQAGKLPANAAVHSLAITASGEIYAGTFGYGLLRSQNHGDSWQKMDVGYDHIWTLEADANGTLYAGTYGGGLYVSADNGTTWKKKDGLSSGYVYSINATGNGQVYLSTWNSGVYMSDNSGGSWMQMGMKGQGASAVIYQPVSKTLFAGTSDGRIYRISAGTTAVEKEQTNAVSYSLDQNYPNPFNPTTSIRYSLPAAGLVRLEVYDMLGKRVAVIADGFESAGEHTVQFDASGLSSGIYFYKLQSGAYTAIRKLVLLK